MTLRSLLSRDFPIELISDFSSKVRAESFFFHLLKKRPYLQPLLENMLIGIVVGLSMLMILGGIIVFFVYRSVQFLVMDCFLFIMIGRCVYPGTHVF